MVNIGVYLEIIEKDSFASTQSFLRKELPRNLSLSENYKKLNPSSRDEFRKIGITNSGTLEITVTVDAGTKMARDIGLCSFN